MEIGKNIFVGLFLAAVSALAFVAYQHPSTYEKYNVWISCLLAAMSVFFTIWNVASDYMASGLYRFLDMSKASEVEAAKDDRKIPTWIFMMLVCLWAYIILLGYLPAIGLTGAK